MRQDILPFQKKIVDQVKDIKANDNKMLKALYHDNYSKFEKYILDNSGSMEQAKDIFQEAFIAVWRNIQLDKFQPKRETSLSGYLYQVAKNKWLDYLRSNHYKRVVAFDNAIVELKETEALAEGENDYIIAVKNNFKNLGENCKEVLTRFYYYKESLKLIAKKFDWTEATARNNKYRCLQRLRELIKK